MDEDKIISKLIEHDERLERLEVKFDDFSSRFDSLLITLDKIMAILLRLDQERVFTFEKIHRIETDVDKIKRHLQIT